MSIFKILKWKCQGPPGLVFGEDQMRNGLQSTRPTVGAQRRYVPGTPAIAGLAPSLELEGLPDLQPGFLPSQRLLWREPLYPRRPRPPPVWLWSRTICRGWSAFPAGHCCPGVLRRPLPHRELRNPLIALTPAVLGLCLLVSCPRCWDPITLTPGRIWPFSSLLSLFRG